MLLVGDSAGMVNPMTGGGIAYAMRAARTAASVLVIGLENDTLGAGTLSEYQRGWYKDFGKEIPSMLLAQRVFTGPFTDLLFTIGSKDEKIQSMVSDSLSETSDKKLDIKSLVSRPLHVCLREALT